MHPYDMIADLSILPSLPSHEVLYVVALDYLGQTFSQLRIDPFDMRQEEIPIFILEQEITGPVIVSYP